MSSTTLRLVDGGTRLVLAENTAEAARQAGFASAERALAVNASVVALAAADRAEIAADIAASPPDFYNTKADATADLGAIAADAYLTVLADETRGGGRVVYQKSGGVLVFRASLSMGFVTLDSFGAAGDGNLSDGSGTDDSAAFAAALNALQAAGGGMLVLGPRAYRLHDFSHTMLNDNTPDVLGRVSQASVKIVGAGAEYHPLNPPRGGSVLMFTGTGSGPRVLTLGWGTLTLEDFCCYSLESGTGRTFFHTASTTVKANRVGFFTPKQGTACDDDPFHFGGNRLAVPWNTVDGPFQGYGSSVTNCVFQGIRRIYLGMYANSVIIRDPVFGVNCGSSLEPRAAIVVNATAEDAVGGVVNTTDLNGNPIALNEESVTGLTIANSLFEMNHYVYGIDAHRVVFSSFIANQAHDTGGGSVAIVHLSSECLGNIVLPGTALGGMVQLVDDSVQKNNAYISGNKDLQCVLPSLKHGIDEAFPSEIRYHRFTAPGGIFAKSTGAYTLTYVCQFSENDNAPFNAGGNIFRITNEGQIQLGGGQAGNVTNAIPGSMQVSDNGRTFTADSNVTLNSNSGGIVLQGETGSFFYINAKFLGQMGWEGLYLPAGNGVWIDGAPVVDGNRHLALRSYTVATLPAAGTAQRMIYVSDGASNKRLAVSDGSNWRFPDGAVVS